MTHIFPQPNNTQRNNGWNIDPNFLATVVAALKNYIEENSADLVAEDFDEILTHAEIALAIWKSNHD